MEFKENQKVWIVEKVMGDWVVNSGIFKNDFLLTKGATYYLVDFSYIEKRHIFSTYNQAKRFLEHFI